MQNTILEVIFLEKCKSNLLKIKVGSCCTTFSVNNICIYDLVGSEIMKLDLTARGYSSITIYGSKLKAGMYLYALLVDGKEVDTKRMILTNN